MNKICGVQIIKNGCLYDYCFKESILAMIECCDYVIVGYIDSEDETLEILNTIQNGKLKILHLTNDDWNFFNDKNRLSYLTNICIQEADRMGFQYVLSIQSDEIISENSYHAIRLAMNEGKEAYLCHRINLWKSPYLELNVEHNRKPCSDIIIRLAKSCYRSYDDAESINAPAVSDYINAIKIWHMGFVRKREVMKNKIINMQCGVFGMADYDNKLNECEIFNPDLWFDPKRDLKPIFEPLPYLIQKWAKERVYD